MDGVVFPQSADGRRSTSRLGREVVTDALRPGSVAAAEEAARERDWRHGYPPHLRRLVVLGVPSTATAVTMAQAGLAAVHARMRVLTADGEIDLDRALTAGAARPLVTATAGGRGEVERGFSLPYRGRRLRGDELHRRLDAWTAAGTIEPSCAEVVRTVAANPDWLDLSDRPVVALGAGAEMGPVHAILRWGGTVIGVDLPRRPLWERVLQVAERYGGRLLVPAAPGSAPLAERAGLDLLHEPGTAAAWLADQEGPLVLGNYVYADGATYLRVATAVDALTDRLLRARPQLAAAFLGTPTDVYAVPPEAVAHADRAYRQGAALRAVRRPLRVLSGGRLLRRNYPPGADPGIIDSLVLQQGPNYALAKRLQRWRATVARQAGTTVSFAVAPPTRTRSVVRNRALAAAYAGAYRFGIEVFEPATSNTLMAAVLVHHLRRPPAGGRARLAGRGVRRGPRRALAGRVPAAQRPRPGGAARPRGRPRLSRPGPPRYPRRMEVAGLVLAAGAGRRYGMPKALVPYEGRLLVERAAGVLQAAGCSPVVVVVGAGADTVRARAELPGAVLVDNPAWPEGMGSSLRAGLDALTATVAPAAIVLLVDMPGITTAAVRRIARHAAPDALAVAGYDGGRSGHPVLLGRAHWPGVAACAVGDTGARDYLRANTHAVRVVPCADVADDADVDRPDPPRP